MSSINLNIPESLTSAAARLSDAGFTCHPYRVEGFATSLTKSIAQGLTVTIKEDHPKFVWDTSNSESTEYVAQIHGQNAIYKSPRGFHFFSNKDEFSLAAQLDTDAQIQEFVECFTMPFGPDGKIVGPLAIPAIKRKLRP